MELILNNLRIPVEKDGAEHYLSAASVVLKIGKEKIQFVKILSKSLDARGKKQMFYEMSVVVSVPDDTVVPAGAIRSSQRKLGSHDASGDPSVRWDDTRLKDRPIIIGFGPAGIFAALELVDRGIKPLIFERGKKIEERDADIRTLIRKRVLDTESNIQFGEGGAGSYSDGKLFSRIKNSDHSNKVLDTFIKFGAPEEIGYMRKPHLGTDVLCKIVAKMRNYILERGGKIFFSSKMTDLLIEDGKCLGVVINSEMEYRSSIVYIALGNSARDSFEMMHAKGVAVEQKPIAVGMRLEHPASLINLIRYGKKYQNYAPIGAATYSFTHTDRKVGRGVYTFCMCPGGEVVNSSSEEGLLAVNGMSYSARASKFSNSAIVVTCGAADYGSTHPLAGVEFQRSIERSSFKAGGENWNVPAQNLTDFLAGKVSEKLNENSYRMGSTPADMKKIFPEFVTEALFIAFAKWKEETPLFVSDQAILLGAETRTSSPVRIKRTEHFESVNIKNLFPIGEGAGYAGGITSSAVDAMKAVEASLRGSII